MKDREVLIFRGEATAEPGNPLNYPAGRRHAALLFMRQERGTSPDWSRAATELETRGWSDVALAEASPVSVEGLSSVHPHASSSYNEAVREGFAVLIFSEPLDANTLTNR